MDYGTIPGINKPVARLVQGTTMLTSKKREEGFALLDAVFEQGGNTFDTAHIYGGGDCERVLGQWINEQALRDRVVILDKGAHHNSQRRRVTPADIASDINDSLERLETDSIDVYLLHRDDPSVEVGPIVEALNEHLQAGRISAFGGSNWTHQRIEQANDYARDHELVPFVASSSNFSLAVMVQEPWEGCISLSGRDNEPARAWYAETQLAVMPWSSLAAGFLSGRFSPEEIRAQSKDQLHVKSFRSEDNLHRLERAMMLARRKGLTVPQVATAYVLAQPMNIFPLVGCQSGEEFAQNAQACEIKLTQEEIAFLELQSDPQ